MIRVIRNPFSEDINEKLSGIMEKSLQEVVKFAWYQNDQKILIGEGIVPVPEWKDCIDRDSLMELYNGKESLDVNNTKNLFHYNDDVASDDNKNDIEKIRNILVDQYKGEVRLSGNFYYPPTGYMGWHTNCGFPCERFYITWASEDKKSFFRYYDYEKDEIITDYDDKGITIRQFNIPDRAPHLWHCVGSECDRLSIGFRVHCNVRLDLETYIELEKRLVGGEGVLSNLRTDYVTELINNDEKYN